MDKEPISQRAENAQVMKRILQYIRPYTGLVILSLVLSVLTVGLTLYIPILTGQGVDYIVGKGQVNFQGLLAVIAGIVASISVTALAQWFMNHINNKITYRIVRDLRVQAFDHLQELPLAYVDRHSSGDLLSRIVTDIDQFSDGLLLGFTQLFTGVATILGTILFMLRINVWITLIVVLLSPLSFLIAGFISKRSFAMFRKQSEARGEITGFTNEMLGGIKVVQAFHHQQEAQEEFDQINQKLSEYSLKATFFSSITNPATRFMYSAIYAGVAIAGGFSAIAGAVTVGQLSSFLSYTNQYTKPFNDITGVLTEFQNSIASAARVFALIDEPPASAEPADAIVLTEPEGRILLEHVDFSYSPENPLIQDLNLSVKPGQRIAIVGPTGCGKTTFLNLLTRIYMPTKGELYIDGEPADPKKHSLAVVFQEPSSMPWLTVEQNLRFGLEIKKMPKDEINRRVENIIKLLGLEEFRNRYPHQLSVSTAQRIIIGRAFALQPDLLLMDEPYGQMDIKLRFYLEDEVIRLWKETGTTVVFITHNIEEAVYLAERILILTNKPAHIKEEVQVNLPRPRDVTAPDFIAIRNHVTEQIKWW